MAVARNQRIYPLTLTAAAINAGIVAAYDWASEDGSTTFANGKDHGGNARNWTAPATPPTVVTTSGGKGVDPTVGGTLSANYYLASNPSALGLSVGTGDFTLWKRVRTPSAAAASTTLRSLGRCGPFVFEFYEIVANNGYHWYIEGDAGFLGWADNPALGPNVITDLHIVRSNGTVKVFVDGVLKKSTPNTTDMTANSTSCVMGSYIGNPKDFVELDDIYWSRALSDAEVAAHRANPYSYYENAAIADSIAVSAPSNSATVSTSIAISGTYAGGTVPTSIEASFNGGAYATIASSPAGGTFSGTLSGQTPGTGTLTVRSKNGTSVVASATVTGVTVVSDSIAFATPDPASNRAMPHRTFQRNGSNQASVRITGTYTGSPTSIQYQWDGGSWATLVASPTGGAFDQTVTLQGPGQGTLAVRFGNSTGISATMPNIGVGDVFIVGGQSNNVGFAPTNYVTAAAPAGHAGWVSTEFDKSGRWRVNVESSAQPFDSIMSGTSNTYPVNATANGKGSYFGALATKIMATGVPVAFVPCALESTGISAWAANTGTGTLYGAMLARATAVGGHKAVLFWDGEANVGDGTTRSAMETALNAIINDWCGTRFVGSKFILMNLCETSGTPGGGTSASSTGYDAIHAAIANVGATNSYVAAVGDMAGKFGQLHYETVPEINAVATVAYNALNSAYGYVVDTPPTILSASVANSAPNVVTLMASEALDANYLPAAGAFPISGHTVSAVGIAGDKINLTVSPAFVNGEAARTAGYAQPGTNNVRDTGGMLLANFTGLTITNNVAAAGSTVNGVTVSPATATVAGGGTLQLSATVAGTNSPSQGVNWSRSPTAGSVSTSGQVTAPAATSSVQIITVTATSQQDGTKSGAATITVPAAVVTPPEEISFIPSRARTLTVHPGSSAFTGGSFWDLANPLKPRITKDPSSVIDITLDWEPWLEDMGSPAIASFSPTFAGIANAGVHADGALTTVFMGAGAGSEASVTFKIKTASIPAREEERTVLIALEEQ